jgi:hypothetical protein
MTQKRLVEKPNYMEACVLQYSNEPIFPFMKAKIPILFFLVLLLQILPHEAMPAIR